MPPFARPLPTPIMFCSAIPTFTKRSGKRDRKFFSLVDETESLTTAQILGLAAARSSSVFENASRQSNRSGLERPSMVDTGDASTVFSELAMAPPRPTQQRLPRAVPALARHDARQVCSQ